MKVDELPVFLSYAEAAQVIDPSGSIGIKARSIETLVRNGELPKVMIAGKNAIRQLDLKAYMEDLGGCQDNQRGHTLSGRSPRKATQTRSISSEISPGARTSQDQPEHLIGQSLLNASQSTHSQP